MEIVKLIQFFECALTKPLIFCRCGEMAAEAQCRQHTSNVASDVVRLSTYFLLYDSFSLSTFVIAYLHPNCLNLAVFIFPNSRH